ncbi:MAG: efflux RND transporter permease subunit, partial [Proteobacteria bacterium]|nr:efflux RND transporter permease subunit [Pseudomonadota bacterium]
MARFFIHRPIFAWVIAILILLVGGIALKNLPVAQYPPVAAPQIAFNVTYPGASAQVVEDTVIKLIEQQMNGIEHLLYMEASSELGAGTLTLTFEPGTNVDISSVEAQNRYKRVEARLPEDVRRLGVPVTKPQRNYLMFVAIFSKDGKRNATDLSSYAAANVLDPLLRVPGVGEAILFGSEYSMRIWLKPDQLTAYGLTPADVKAALQAQNVQLATGELNQAPASAGAQVNAVIVTRGRLKTPEEFGNVVVRALPNGATVKVKDVARVELGAESYDRYARMNGQPIAAIAIRVAPGANALDVAKSVKSRMAELAHFFPEGVDWAVPYDTSRFVEISIFEVVKTLGEAMILVFIVMYVFLGHWRTT